MTDTAHDILTDRALHRAATRLRPADDPAEIVARAAWSVITEPGDGVAGALIEACGAPEALRAALGEADTTPKTRSTPSLAEARRRWTPRAHLGAVHDGLRACAEVDGRMLLPGDPGWPAGLDDLGSHAPLLLWARGSVDPLGGDTVGIVGARASTAYGDAAAAEIAGDLAARGTIIVSGGAYGIDAAAHRAALGVGGTTIAFLAGGVDRPYPAGHQQLFARIREHGALYSEVPCGAAPTKWRFLSRNRMIAAATRATVVVEAGWRSGSLNTAGHAATLGRPLGAVPGPITSAASAGCHRLLREYDAVCVTNAAEVRELWGEDAGEPQPIVRVDPDHTRLRDAMSARSPRTAEDIARRSGLSPQRVQAMLGMLALEGEVRQGPDGWALQR